MAINGRNYGTSGPNNIHYEEEHNTSSDMQKLRIKFDKLTSHDITFVGIIQTARASGLDPIT